MATETGLHWADILVFTAVLVISAAIGLFYAVKARRATPDELLMGQRRLPVVPLIFSLSVSFVSAVSVLGVPAETYANGCDYWLVGFGYIWALALTGVVVLPVMYKLRLVSAYEYLELRFSKPVRLLASFTFIFLMIFYMAIVLYAPALALSSVTHLSMEVSILAIGVVCTFYTAVGGIKAVIWTDVFQTLILTAGLLALIVRGVVEVGGVSQVVDRVVSGGRGATYPMDFNPFIRHTFWTLCVGGGFGMMAIYAGNQATLQRYLSAESLTKSRIILFVNIPLSNVFLGLMCLSGLVMYAYYQGRDPLQTGRIQKRDQLLPLFVMDILGDLHGLPGLFIACVFSAALSTVSSGVNSLATVTIEDLIKPLLLAVMGVLPSDRSLSVIVILTGGWQWPCIKPGHLYVDGHWCNYPDSTVHTPGIIELIISQLGCLRLVQTVLPTLRHFSCCRLLIGGNSRLHGNRVQQRTLPAQWNILRHFKDLQKLYWRTDFVQPGAIGRHRCNQHNQRERQL